MKKKDIPNLITGLRMLLSPVIAPIVWSGHVGIGIILFIVTALTDLVDGQLARHWDVQSVEGKYLDMVADKEFAFIMLASALSIVPTLSICLGLEVLIARVNSKSFAKHHQTSSAMVGKEKTVLLSILMGVSLLLPFIESLQLLFPFLLVSTVGYQIASLTHYIKHYQNEEKRLKEYPEKPCIPTEEQITDLMNQSSISMHLINQDRIRTLYRTHLYQDYVESFAKPEKSEYDNGLLIEEEDKVKKLQK